MGLADKYLTKECNDNLSSIIFDIVRFKIV